MSRETNQPIGATITEEALFDYGWRMFEHLTDQIQNADTKASLILGVDALLLGTLAGLVAARISALPADNFSSADMLSVIMLGLALVMLGTSVYYALIATRPSMKRPKEGGLFYFSMIRAFSPDRFIEYFDTITSQQVRHDLLAQIHTLAGITQRKFQRNASSLNLLLGSLFLWAFAEIITIFG